MSMLSKRWARSLALAAAGVVSCCLLAAPAALGGSPQDDEKSPKKEEKKPAEAPPRVYTNADLPPDPLAKGEETETTEGSSVPSSQAARPQAEVADPLKALEQAQGVAETRRRQIADAERRLEDAKSRVRELENRELAFRNPFLPRPKLSPEEAEAMKGMDNAQKARVTQEALAQARKDVDTAQEALDGLKAGAR